MYMTRTCYTLLVRGLVNTRRNQTKERNGAAQNTTRSTHRTSNNRNAHAGMLLHPLYATGWAVRALRLARSARPERRRNRSQNVVGVPPAEGFHQAHAPAVQHRGSPRRSGVLGSAPRNLVGLGSPNLSRSNVGDLPNRRRCGNASCHSQREVRFSNGPHLELGDDQLHALRGGRCHSSSRANPALHSGSDR